jgi:peptidoglycan/LPS O-acetylase OafA/YrhL
MLRDNSAAPNLDILRALAVLMVLAAHVTEMVAHQNPALSIRPYDLIAGRLGVLLFFVHTALVLNHSMERSRLAGWDDIKSFYVRRVARIYPLAIATVVLVVAVEVPRMPWLEYQPNTMSLLTSLTLTGNLINQAPVITPMWSLPVEVQMYALLPLIYLLVKGRPLWALGLWLLSIPLAWVQPTYAPTLNVIGFSPCFLAGVLAYTMSKRAGLKLPGAAWLPALVALGVLYAVLQAPTPVDGSPLQWLLCLAVGAAIPMFAESTAESLNRGAAIVAKYSYGIYLSHIPAIWIGCVVFAELSIWLQWVIAAASMCALSWLGYHLVEEPGIRLGAKWAGRRAVVVQPAT